MTRFDGPLSGDKITVISAEGPDVILRDSDFLFTAHFSRSGHDLVLTGEHGKSAVILDYFSQPDPPALSTPEGATLKPHVVSALAGSQTPGQYAQAGDQQPAESIGKVVTLEGSATAQRTDGTLVQLNVGDQVAQGDVLQTADGSALGLVFVDGTVFSLTGASRMVLDSLVYQSGGSNNALSFDIVQGTFSFVAGQVAPTGEMRIDTPVASLGIRGTTPGGICANGGPCTFFIAPDPGSTRVGQYVLIGSNGQILQVVSDPSFQYTVSADGSLVTEPLDPGAQEIIQKLIQAFERRAAANEDEDDTGANGDEGTSTANAQGSGIENFSATSATDSAIQAGLTDGIESLTESGSEETAPGTGSETASTATTGSSGSTAADSSNNPPPPPDPTIEDDAGAVVEDGGGTSGTLNTAVVAQPATPGLFGTFSIAADGTWTYVLNNESPAVQALAQGDVRTESFTVTGTNGATATVVITITGTNDAPVAVADTVAAEFQTGTTFTAAELLSNDSDIDSPNTALSIAGVTSGAGGTAVLNLDGSVTFNPDEGFSGTATFTYTVTDGIATSAPVTVSVIVDGNDAPVASPVTLAAIAEDSGARLITQAELLAGVTDPDGPSVTITALSIAAGSGTLIDNGNGTWTYTPAANDDTGVSFNYTVSDGTSAASSTASLDITPVNDAPVITGDLQADINTVDPYVLSVDDVNPGDLGYTDVEGDEVTFTVSNLVNGKILVNGIEATSFSYAQLEAGLVAFQHNGSETSLASFDVSVEDG
ncbi:MAG: cadherin-like domain-containing protein, partial [Rhizobiales bacterium]|nr:cadherin-like domain-containing protein [Hyphomicrobiales bacterium]